MTNSLHRPRTGVVLAAGFGSRLRAGHPDTTHKTLLPLGGRRIIDWVFDGLVDADCTEIVVVTGNNHLELESQLPANIGEIPIRCVYNPEFELSNGVSLIAAGPFLAEEFVLVMSDHVVDRETMLAIAHVQPAPRTVTLLVDSKIDAVFDLDDATRVRRVPEKRGDGLGNSRLISAIGKNLEDYDAVDVGVFLATRVFVEAAAYLRAQNGDVSLSQAGTHLIGQQAMFAWDIGSGTWQDIDDPAMFAHAAAKFDPTRRAFEALGKGGEVTEGGDEH